MKAVLLVLAKILIRVSYFVFGFPLGVALVLLVASSIALVGSGVLVLVVGLVVVIGLPGVLIWHVLWLRGISPIDLWRKEDRDCT